MSLDFNEIAHWVQVLEAHNLLQDVKARTHIWDRLQQAIAEKDVESMREALEKADFYGLLTNVWTSRFGDKFQVALRLAEDQSLRRKLIRLAHREPELRSYLLPLVK